MKVQYELNKGNRKFPMSARELYRLLYDGNMKHFDEWSDDNIKNNAFAFKDDDYQIIQIQGKSNETGRPRSIPDFLLTIEFAESLTPVFPAFKVKIAMDYFVACEKNVRENNQQVIQSTLTEALYLAALLAKKNEEYTKEVNETYQLKSYLHFLEISYSIN